MTKKYDNFLIELKKLCNKHKVELTSSGYDLIGVWDREEEHPSLQQWTCILEDKTKEKK